MMIGACQTDLKGARAFSVDLIEVLRRTIADVFEMDSSNVSAHLQADQPQKQKRVSDVQLRNADLLHVSLLTAFAGLWSGHQRSFELAELSRGMLINVSIRGGQYRYVHTERLASCAGEPGCWKVWTITPQVYLWKATA